MKEITRIHLASTPYNIELAAKKELEKYLHGIEQALSADDDTLREIEARMIELLSEHGVTGEKVITSSDVKMLKERLGAPGEFVDEPLQATVEIDKKRLMRDEKKGMAGGVFAGVAAYTNIDVTWYRIAAIVLAFVSFGTALLVYLVLWIAIPPARTAAERLQMRGERATLERIQEESTTEVRDTPARNKPLVIVLRVLIVLTLLGIMFGALAVVAAALFAGIPILSMSDWMTNSWLISALVVGSLSGILLAVLMGVGLYMVMAWRASKPLLVVSGIIIVAGLVSFATSAGLGAYGAREMQSTVERHTTTRREDLADLNGATSLKIARTSTEVSYKVTSGEPYAGVVSFQRDTRVRVPVKVKRDGDTAILQVGELRQKDCTNWLEHCAYEHVSATVYGPALTMLDTTSTDTSYETETTQESLKVNANGSVNITGRITALEASLKGGSLDASDAAVDVMKLSVDDASTVDVGVVRSLAVTVPTSCAADSKNEVSYERAADIQVNGAPATPASTACLELDSED